MPKHWNRHHCKIFLLVCKKLPCPSPKKKDWTTFHPQSTPTKTVPGNVVSVAKSSASGWLYKCTFVPSLPRDHSSVAIVHWRFHIPLIFVTTWSLIRMTDHSSVASVDVHSRAQPHWTITCARILERSRLLAKYVGEHLRLPRSSNDTWKYLGNVGCPIKMRSCITKTQQSQLNGKNSKREMRIKNCYSSRPPIMCLKLVSTSLFLHKYI